jgi:hypothetical protein
MNSASEYAGKSYYAQCIQPTFCKWCSHNHIWDHPCMDQTALYLAVRTKQGTLCPGYEKGITCAVYSGHLLRKYMTIRL